MTTQLVKVITESTFQFEADFANLLQFGTVSSIPVLHDGDNQIQYLLNEKLPSAKVKTLNSNYGHG